MLFDPSSSTLYVDSHLANNLQLDDGTSVELPTDVLLNSINSGQVQVINSNSKMDVGESKAVQAQVIKPGWYIPYIPVWFPPQFCIQLVYKPQFGT